ncbi:MAG: hypothetical protein ACM3SV_08830 [Betaproteobacteria bacterium]
MKNRLTTAMLVTTLVSLASFGALGATQIDKVPLDNQTAKAPAPKTTAQTKESWDWGNKGQADGPSTKAAAGQKTSRNAPGSAATNKAMNKTDKPAPKAPVKVPAADGESTFR